ncbi:vascular endothelial growth factor receptor 2-like isoform X2 [Scyliorhinus canicula]|uniref:vascular endothelial growth factor receptor 2-like isoform X2 n=1 Tax=Scyliorhinus canicula TaxID=7830 RepID=UPI0018F70BAA|nr:vascular endothelial growth factor receptor 2-like isoform X2 [Scyliorhinus canicula]
MVTAILLTIINAERQWLSVEKIIMDFGQEEVPAVIGSSPLLDPEIGAALGNSEVIWEFIGSDANLVTILDYVPDLTKEEPNEQFKDRLHFNESTATLTVINVTVRDEGIYILTVNGRLRSRIILKFFEPLSEPSINTTCVNTTITLTCQVRTGKASSVLWWKDGKIITNGQNFLLMQNNSSLIIYETNKSDCGIFTCTMKNPVSEKSYSFALSINGDCHSVNGNECEPSKPVNNVQANVILLVIVVMFLVVAFSIVCREVYLKGRGAVAGEPLESIRTS